MADIPAELREELAFQRALGADFESAWGAALAAARELWRSSGPSASPGNNWKDWNYAFASTRDAWERAYHDEALPARVRAVAELAVLLEAIESYPGEASRVAWPELRLPKMDAKLNDYGETTRARKLREAAAVGVKRRRQAQTQ